MITLTKAQRENALATLKPMEVAQLLYEHCGKDAKEFAADLWEHLTNAFVIATPRLFIMGRAVMLEDGRHAWLVNMMVGELAELFHHIPFPLECVAFPRRGEKRLRIYEYTRFMQIATRRKQT